MQGLLTASGAAVQAEPSDRATDDEDFGRRPSVDMVAGGTMIAIRIIAIIIAAFGIGSEDAIMGSEFSSAGGTLAILIPTQSGLVVAADMRQTPKGIFCDGINKILIPKRPARTAVVVTGLATLSDMSAVPANELCAYLAQNASPIDFGRSAIEFLESQNVAVDKFSGDGLTEKIYADVLPYLKAGNLRDHMGTRVAQIVFADFDPETKTSRIRVLGVDLTGPVGFQLQPVQITNATTLLGDNFGPETDQTVLPFGEVEYFRDQVLAGPGKALLSPAYSELIQKIKVAEIDPNLAATVAINLIDVTAKTTEMVAAPSGIGGGVSAVLFGNETKVLQ